MAETSMTTVARVVLDSLEELVGCPAEGVTGVSRADDGWTVTAEVLELARVPETTDVMASYEVNVDTKGQVTGYHRVRRYLRAQVDEQ